MSRLTQISDNAASADAANLFTAIKSKVGMVPNLYRVMAHEPAVLAAALNFNDTLGEGSFTPETREALALAVAGANACDYCASAHSAISKSIKVDEAEIAARLQGRSSDPKLNAILKFAVAVVDKRGLVSDADLSDARNAGLSEGEIVETVAVAVANILTNYINHVAQTDIDFPVVRTQEAA
ncbi:carboxymuconolactone decarboxylase family protein [Hyphococcus luteus]|uniref:Peroxidase n=1 Tax=Hyphococcus luteus TaxID=2058213 RepID=A0A2S7K827_9PROT|nr:carboxymuconolactone decarboxylase family protein [Marinicaulis flavus]PQA88642.1 peroxidase [Marinicaulis flavus]